MPCRLKNAAPTALRHIATACKGLWSLIRAYPKTSAAFGLFIVTFLRRDVLIQPITFPTAITYDGHVAAKRLAYHMKQLQEEAHMDREIRSIYIDPLFLQLPSFSVGGLTVDPFTLLTMLQHYLKLSTSFISGEVTQGDKEMLLTLQGSFGDSVHSIEFRAASGTDVDTLLQGGAEKFLSEVHPLLMATYWSQTKGDSTTAVALIRRALADHEHKPQPESTITSIRRLFGENDTNTDVTAYLLWGWILTRDGQFDSAKNSNRQRFSARERQPKSTTIGDGRCFRREIRPPPKRNSGRRSRSIL